MDADGGSHSWHDHVSIKMSCAISASLGRHCAWIHRRQRLNWMRFGSPESPSPRRQRKSMVGRDLLVLEVCG